MALTTEYANKILKDIFDYHYLALSITAPNTSGGNVSEPPSGANYYRVSATSGNFAAENKAITNQNYVYFPEATASWGTIQSLCVFDKYEGGNLIYYGALTAPVAVNENSVPLFRPGTINISLDA